MGDKQVLQRTVSAEFEASFLQGDDFIASGWFDLNRSLCEMELTCLARSLCHASELSLLGRTRQHYLAPKPQPKSVSVRTGAGVFRGPSSMQQTSKAVDSKRARRPENVDGEFYVGMNFLPPWLLIVNYTTVSLRH